MIPLPSKDPISPIKLADWLEISAIISPDKNSSRGDLEGALRRASLDLQNTEVLVSDPEDLRESDKIEMTANDAFLEIESRNASASDAYPFELDMSGGVLALRKNWQDYVPYVFCLLISYYGFTPQSRAAKLFEEISYQAARRYIDGEVVEFGWPRKTLPTGFVDALKELSRKIGEGSIQEKKGHVSKKDDGLDLVVFKDFQDKKPSKLIMFGQCAAGNNWEEKVTELQSDVFCRTWFPIASPFPIRSFFIPHCIEGAKWEDISLRAGIVFDRCRIAYWAHQTTIDYDSHIGWVKRTLRQQNRAHDAAN